MKRTYTANIDGQVFHIDDDAFDLLQNYLQKLKITFTGEEGKEIVTDIESRIREHFNEKIASGAGVIVLADVENVIETMGRPEDLSETNSGTEAKSDTTASDGEAPFISVNFPSGKKLYRNMRSRVFGGVIGGIATYLGWNANIMRILYVILALSLASIFTIWPFVIVYLVAWMIIPPARTPRQILQMKGRPVNIDTVGRAVMEDAEVTPPPYSEQQSFFSSFFSVLGKCVMGFIGGVSTLSAILSALVFIAMCVFLITYSFGGALNPALWAEFSTNVPFHMSILLLAGITTASLLCVILFTVIAWGSFAMVFNGRGPAKATLVTLAIAGIMLFIATVVLLVCAA